MAKTVEKTYETVFIVDSLFEEDKVDSIIQKYSDLLTKDGCNIVKVDKWGRRKLAYAIKKKNSGYYVTIEFSGPSKVISKLERAYHLDDSIMRFIVITFDKKTYELRKEYLVKKEQDAEARREAAENAEKQEKLTSEAENTPETMNPTEEIKEENVPGKEE